MHKSLLLMLLLLAGCENKDTANPKAPAPTEPAAPAPAPVAAQSVAQGDPVVGDTIATVYDKWGKPEVFKLSLEGDAMFYEFVNMPQGINPDAKLTLYYVKKNAALVFAYNGVTEQVQLVGPISEGERDMVEATARRNDGTVPIPVPTLPPGPSSTTTGGGP